METGINLDFRLLLEGVDVPFQAASVSVARNGPATASISLAPTAALQLLEPKTLAHIFFREELLPRETPSNQSSQNWKLLFEGEVVGVAPQREASGRAFGISCEGLANNWFYTQVYVVLGASPMLFGELAKLVGTGSSDLSKVFVLAKNLADIIAFFNKGEIADVYLNILTELEKAHLQLQGVQTRLKLKERVFVKPDQEIKELVRDRDYFAKTLQSAIGAEISYTSPVLQLLNLITEMLYYDWVEILAPRDMTHQLIFKPGLYFMPPPECNVLFPNRYTSQSAQRSFMEEPTRIVLQAPSFMVSGDTGAPNNVITPYYYAPEELALHVQEISRRTAAKSGSQADQLALKALSTTFLTSEEKVKGIITRYPQLTSWEWVAGTKGEKGKVVLPKERDAFIQNIASYKFFLERFANRNNQMVGAFNPYHVVGFPFLQLSSVGHYIGLLESMTHQFSPKSGGTTTLQVSYERVIGSRIETAKGTKTFGAERFAFPPIPPWINKAYRKGDVYREILGVPAVGAGGAPENVPQLEADIAKFTAVDIAAKEVALRTAAFDLYDRIVKEPENEQALSLEINRRPIISEKEYMAFVGASGGGGLGDVPIYSGGPFRQANQQAILEHVNLLGGRDALEGF